MKLYIKNNKIKKRSEIIISRNGFNTFNPSEEMLFSDGWVEYSDPEPTDEELFRQALNNKINEIKEYDSSSLINEFTINDFPVWLDKATRTGLMLRFQSENAVGLTSTTLWYSGVSFSLELTQALRMLYAIEIYASQCYDNTERHISEVSKLTTIEEINEYDFTTGYPEKLKF